MCFLQSEVQKMQNYARAVTIRRANGPRLLLCKRSSCEGEPFREEVANRDAPADIKKSK